MFNNLKKILNAHRARFLYVCDYPDAGKHTVSKDWIQALSKNYLIMDLDEPLRNHPSLSLIKKIMDNLNSQKDELKNLDIPGVYYEVKKNEAFLLIAIISHSTELTPEICEAICEWSELTNQKTVFLIISGYKPHNIFTRILCQSNTYYLRSENLPSSDPKAITSISFNEISKPELSIIYDLELLGSFNQELFQEVEEYKPYSKTFHTLLDKNLFDSTSIKNQIFYRFNPYFKNNLQNTDQLIKPIQLSEESVNLIVLWFLKNDLIIDACEFLFKIRETERSYDLLQTHLESLLKNGFHRRCLNIIDSLSNNNSTPKSSTMIQLIFSTLILNTLKPEHSFIERLLKNGPLKSNLIQKTPFHFDLRHQATLNIKTKIINHFFNRKKILHPEDNIKDKTAKTWAIADSDILLFSCYQEYKCGKINNAIELIQMTLKKALSEDHIHNIIHAFKFFSTLCYRSQSIDLHRRWKHHLLNYAHNKQYLGISLSDIFSILDIPLEIDSNKLKNIDFIFKRISLSNLESFDYALKFTYAFYCSYYHFCTFQFEKSKLWLKQAREYEVHLSDIDFIYINDLNAFEAMIFLSEEVHLDLIKAWSDHHVDKTIFSTNCHLNNITKLAYSHLKFVEKEGILASKILESVIQESSYHNLPRDSLAAHILIAVFLNKKNKLKVAFDHYKAAVSIAKKTDSIRPFLMFGKDILPLVDLALKKSFSIEFSKKIKKFLSEEQTFKKIQETSKIECLSKREVEILDLIYQGKSNEAISKLLCRSLGTIKLHTHNVYKKLNVKNRVEAINEYRKYLATTQT